MHTDISSNITGFSFDAPDTYLSILHLRELNPYITCSMCAGYLIDATTITECHHRFCKACIVKHLQTCKFCPECNTQVNDLDPLSCLAFDRTAQDIVYKLVPGLQESEDSLRTNFYISRSLDIPNFNLWSTPPKKLFASSEIHFPSYDEKLSLQVKPHSSLSNYTDANLLPVKRNHIRCSIRTLIYHLKRFLHCRVKVPHAYELELMCEDSLLKMNMSLKDVYLKIWSSNDANRPCPIIISYTLKKRLS